MSQADDPITLRDLQKYLPHRYPFLLIDRILDYRVGESLLALKNVTHNEPHFPGHFPGMPVMPGVLILEALAQACGVLAAKTTEQGAHTETIMLYAGIDKARFKRQVVPGDVLHLSIELKARKRDIWKFSGVASVDGQVACAADMMCAIKSMDNA